MSKKIRKNQRAQKSSTNLAKKSQSPPLQSTKKHTKSSPPIPPQPAEAAPYVPSPLRDHLPQPRALPPNANSPTATCSPKACLGGIRMARPPRPPSAATRALPPNANSPTATCSPEACLGGSGWLGHHAPTFRRLAPARCGAGRSGGKAEQELGAGAKRLRAQVGGQGSCGDGPSGYAEASLGSTCKCLWVWWLGAVRSFFGFASSSCSARCG